MERERPLRILMVLESDFTHRGGGGAESQVRTLARHLIGRGQPVAIVTPLFAFGPQVRAERSSGIPVGRLRYPRVPVLGAGVMCLRLAAFLLGRGRRYDAWHVHIAHHMGAVTCLVGALVGKPVVVKVSGWWELEKGVMAKDRGLLDALAHRLLKRGAAFQAISTRIAAELVRQGFPAERIIVLPNAVDTSRFSARRAGRAPGAPFTAVFVGRLVPEKGLGTLLAAWARAFEGRKDARLRLVGEGRLEAELRAQARALGIAEEVEFLGHHGKVEEILATADVGVLPSNIEGLSNTLLEFMASGLPTIATRVSGSEDFVVTGRNGWLFDPGDVDALAAHLGAAATLPAAALDELGRRARADVEQASALEHVTGRLLELYRGTPPHVLAKAS
ncbi:MAG TPA: glycosyltransferase [Polyangia bacterium]|nr:glycosyltransferase [Polyangia bacterium]